MRIKWCFLKSMTLTVAAVFFFVSLSGFGGVVTNDYSWVRGTHYRLNGDAAKTARELGYGKRIGLNAVRFWMSQGEWRKNPEAAVGKYRAFVRQAWNQGYRSMPILFNGNGLDPAMLEGASWADCEAYATDVVSALKGEPGLLMWDVMNEPTYNAWVGHAPDADEKARRREKTHAFVRRACALVKRLDPGSPTTLGCANFGEASATADCVDVLSFHDYSSTRADVEKNYALMDGLGKRTGKPVIQSETGCTGYGNAYEMALEACARHKFGWFFFNLVIGGYTETFHGVFYEDGTVRHPDAIAAMMGCYRKRDLETIIPAKPFKPGKEERLVVVVRNLREQIDGDDAPRLFEEMERAANYLESCEAVPMDIPPTARIMAWRKMENPPMDEARALARALASRIEKILQTSSCAEPRDTAAERERRTDEIAAWLQPEPRADGARWSDRAAWGRLAAMPEAAEWIAKADAALVEEIPSVSDDLYLEFSRTGNRSRYETPFFARLDNLASLRFAECLEGEGRFVAKIVEYLDAICAMRTWVVPAHDEELAAFHGANKIDLFSATYAFEVAQTYDWLKAVLPEETKRKVRAECERRIFSPYLYLARNFRDDEKRNRVEPNRRWYDGRWNWNSVCHSCVVRAALAMVEDRRTRAAFVASAEYAVPFALSAYLDDGYCAEGVGYWNYGYGHHATLGLSVRAATGGKVDFFADPKNRLTTEYAYDIQLEPGKAPSISDSTGGPSRALRALMRQVYPDLCSEDVARCGVLTVDGNVGRGLSLVALRAFGQEPPIPSATAFRRLPPHSWFPAAQLLVARMTTSGGARLGMSVNGGHNDEPHNHNDLGSYTIMLDGVEMGGDPGGEVYTERTFSALRYESRIVNSYGHPVPVVDLKLQGTGRQFAAEVLKTSFLDARDEIVYDLTGAYPLCSLESLTRRVVFDRVRGEIAVTDAAKFSKPSAFEVPFITCRDWKKGADGSFVFAHPDDGRALKMSIVSSAPVVLRDEKLANPGRTDVERLGFSFANLVRNATLTMTFSAGGID